ncbi:MAG TPA: hypothetical protein VFW20_10755 [Candidatus Limnocylindrales bacterium]|nr:hypothetical protein [Candidatus Limnocylindrales bacterium]
MSLPSQPSLPLRGPARADPDAEPSHPCIRCGRPVADPSAGLCEQCNPLELAQPSATQVHGIAAFGIVAFVVVLAVVGHAAIAGVGPFTGVVLGTAPASGGLTLTLTVHNAGSRSGATTCEIVPASRPAGFVPELVQTPPIPAGGDLQFTALVTKFGSTPIQLASDCQSP